MCRSSSLRSLWFHCSQVPLALSVAVPVQQSCLIIAFVDMQKEAGIEKGAGDMRTAKAQLREGTLEVRHCSLLRPAQYEMQPVLESIIMAGMSCDCSCR